MKTTISWFSAGITSTVATKLALKRYENISIYFCETGAHHPDNLRFIKDCEQWFGQKINVLTNTKWKSVEKVLEAGYINSPHGAHCTKVLKKDVRIALEKIIDYDTQVFGFEYDTRQIKRAERFVEQYPTSRAVFPLIEEKLTKKDCLELLSEEGIELPAMYRLGYSNNNCVGCVKGGMGYWNKIRVDFPEVFKRTAELERLAGHSCIKGKFLDELSPNAGRFEKIELPECGIYCEVEGLPEK
jgi:3'-phosphoadenosine 5'-phosphosulfate sulfotransferase (PAPS reductase)/FAD synthetase